MFLLIGCAICVAVYAVAGWAQSADNARIDLRISEGRLTLKADDVTLGTVLQRIAQELNARLTISADAGTRIGHWDLRQEPVETAIPQIARGSNIVIVVDHQGASNDKFFVREIYLLGDSAPDSGLTEQTSPVQAQRVPELARMLTTKDASEARRAAAAELGRIGGEASVEALDKALSDDDPGVRVEAVKSLGRIGTDDAIRLVGQAGIGSSDPNVSEAARRVLEASTNALASVMLAAIKSGASSVTSLPR